MASQVGRSVRCGVLAMKCGMMPVWDQWGMRRAVTVLEVADCKVLQVKRKETDGYTAVQVGAGKKRSKRVRKAQLGHMKKYLGADLDFPVSTMAEFRVTEDALLEPGATIGVRHFVAGQYLDVQGKSTGKGYAGVMKRHNFSGMQASHGVSLNHRGGGSIGACQDPGRVFKGKKMSGRMGNKKVTTQNLKLYGIDLERNLLFVEGAVPGPKGNLVKLMDAKKKPLVDDLPIPTAMDELNLEELEETFIVCPQPEKDPHVLES